MSPVPRLYAWLLLALTFLFALRVTGQALVAVHDVAWLPPFDRWHSGLVPYPILLGIQIVLIALMLAIVRDFARGFGFFVSLSPGTGKILIALSILYALAMVLRYIVTMTMHPELRWFTGTIPIWFHFVLAAFIYLLGRFSVRYGAKRT
jgi:hypothetical protein